MLDKALETVQSLKYGDDIEPLKAIDDAIVATHGNSDGRKQLETQMLEVLQSDATRNGKDYICRKLRLIGSEESVPALASLLSDKELSHMARYALESMPSDAAGAALREALPKVDGELKEGVISSLGVRQDDRSVPALAALVSGEDAAIAKSASEALGAIRTTNAAKALVNARPNAAAAASVTDSLLACAESLLAAGDKATALTIYQKVSSGEPPKYVKLAATRGMLACAAN